MSETNMFTELPDVSAQPANERNEYVDWNEKRKAAIEKYKQLGYAHFTEFPPPPPIIIAGKEVPFSYLEEYKKNYKDGWKWWLLTRTTAATDDRFTQWEEGPSLAREKLCLPDQRPNDFAILDSSSWNLIARESLKRMLNDLRERCANILLTANSKEESDQQFELMEKEVFALLDRRVDVYAEVMKSFGFTKESIFLCASGGAAINIGKELVCDPEDIAITTGENGSDAYKMLPTAEPIKKGGHPHSYAIPLRHPDGTPYRHEEVLQMYLDRLNAGARHFSTTVVSKTGLSYGQGYENATDLENTPNPGVIDEFLTRVLEYNSSQNDEKKVSADVDVVQFVGRHLLQECFRWSQNPAATALNHSGSKGTGGGKVEGLAEGEMDFELGGAPHVGFHLRTKTGDAFFERQKAKMLARGVNIHEWLQALADKYQIVFAPQLVAEGVDVQKDVMTALRAIDNIDAFLELLENETPEYTQTQYKLSEIYHIFFSLLGFDMLRNDSLSLIAAQLPRDKNGRQTIDGSLIQDLQAYWADRDDGRQVLMGGPLAEGKYPIIRGGIPPRTVNLINSGVRSFDDLRNFLYGENMQFIFEVLQFFGYVKNDLPNEDHLRALLLQEFRGNNSASWSQLELIGDALQAYIEHMTKEFIDMSEKDIDTALQQRVESTGGLVSMIAASLIKMRIKTARLPV